MEFIRFSLKDRLKYSSPLLSMRIYFKTQWMPETMNCTIHYMYYVFSCLYLPIIVNLQRWLLKE